MKTYKIAIVILSALLTASCGKNKKAEETHAHEEHADVVELTPSQITASDVKLGSVQMRPVSNTLKVNGEIASLPQNNACVSMPLGGRIRSVSLMPGSPVRKGQTLAFIENPDFIDIQQSYLEAKSKLEYVSADYKRQKELFNNDAASKKNLQLVTSEYKSLKIQIHALEQKLLLIGINPHRLNDRNITRSVAVKSPMSGYVKNVNVSLGQMISPSDKLFEIVSLENLFIKLTIFEKDIDKISKGQLITFYINDEEESHDAVVYQTTKTIDDDKSYKVYASIRSKCGNILPGMYVNARICSLPMKSPTLPDEAVVSFGGKNYIFVYNRQKKEHGLMMTEYKMIQVKKGVSQDGFTQITVPSGIDTNKIVVKGVYSLLSAMKNSGEMSC